MVLDRSVTGLGRSIDTVVSGYGTGLLISMARLDTANDANSRLNMDSHLISVAIADDAGYAQWFGSPAPDAVFVRDLLKVWCLDDYVFEERDPLYMDKKMQDIKIISHSKLTTSSRDLAGKVDLLVKLKLYRNYRNGHRSNTFFLEWTLGLINGVEFSFASARQLIGMNYMLSRLLGRDLVWEHFCLTQDE